MFLLVFYDRYTYVTAKIEWAWKGLSLAFSEQFARKRNGLLLSLNRAVTEN